MQDKPYYNSEDIYQISSDRKVSPAIRGSYCYYERSMDYKNIYYAHVNIIKSGGELVPWLIKHMHLTNMTRELALDD